VSRDHLFVDLCARRVSRDGSRVSDDVIFVHWDRVNVIGNCLRVSLDLLFISVCFILGHSVLRIIKTNCTRVYLDRSRVLGYVRRVGRDASRISADGLTVCSDSDSIFRDLVWVCIYSLGVLADTHHVGIDFELVWLNCLIKVFQKLSITVDFCWVIKDMGIVIWNGFYITLNSIIVAYYSFFITIKSAGMIFKWHHVSRNILSILINILIIGFDVSLVTFSLFFEILSMLIQFIDLLLIFINFLEKLIYGLITFIDFLL